jgi:hypothetical protein
MRHQSGGIISWWTYSDFGACDLRYPTLSSLSVLMASRSGSVTHGTGFFEFFNRVPHCITMWHLGFRNLCLESLLNIFYIFSTTSKHVPLETCALQQITSLSQHTSFLPHYLAQYDCLAADRQGQGDTRLTLSPSVISNSNYVIMVSDWNCLKYCIFACFCTVIVRSTETFWLPCTMWRRLCLQSSFKRQQLTTGY